MSTAFKRKLARAQRTAARTEPLEEEIHTEVVRQLRQVGVRLFHVPNESKSAPQYRAKLRRLGVSKGVPDLIIVDPPPHKPGCFAAALEIKRKGGRASAEQREWIEYMEQCGWATAIEYGLDACLERLREWGYLPGDARSNTSRAA